MEKANVLIKYSMAKINLALDVLGQREDGYHEVKMIMQSIHLKDDIILEQRDKKEIVLTSNSSEIPLDKKNIAYKAAKLIMEEYAIHTGIHIHIEKRIPVAAGLAGGSGNAAAVLEGMNELYNLNIPKEELMEKGLRIGADVPYCILKKTALAEGIGEKLSILPEMPECIILIANPGLAVSTKEVYEGLHKEMDPFHPDVEKVIEGLEKKNLSEIAENMGNILEVVTIKKHPVIEEIKKCMKENGALNALMSGSGSSVFGIYEKIEDARETEKELKTRLNIEKLFITKPYKQEEER